MAAVVLWIIPSAGYACTACNYQFMEEILENRADTPVGQDLMAAMENQRGLPLDAYSSVPEGFREAMRLAPLVAQAEGTPQRPATRSGGAASPPELSMYEGHDFIEVIARDLSLPLAPTSYVPQTATPDKSFTIELSEGQVYLGNNVVYDGFTTNGTVPGPTIIVDEGDIVEFNVSNLGTVPHGASIHAAYTQTSKYLGSIQPGETKKVLFRATHPGIYMYHCAPGGHAIPMHVLFGQYGMMVVRPKKEQYQLEKLLGHGPDIEINLVQHEWYANGKDAIEGNPSYITFNGKLFRYIEEPIKAKPGDYVRINFLNIGPNLLSTFHLVGIIWDYAYWQGHPEAVFKGGQTVTAGPSDSWVVEFRVPPDEGPYLMLSHAVGSTSRGAIGLLVADREAETPVTVTAEGPRHTPEEIAAIAADAIRVISPFKPGRGDLEVPASFGDDTKEVTVKIIGNSYYPKVVEITPGTTVTWVNEDVFSYLAGEFSGIHNAAAVGGPERFVTPLLAHAERHSVTFELEGEYPYICTPHPYMEGRIIVRSLEEARAGLPWGVILGVVAILLAVVALVSRRR